MARLDIEIVAPTEHSVTETFMGDILALPDNARLVALEQARAFVDEQLDLLRHGEIDKKSRLAAELGRPILGAPDILR